MRNLIAAFACICLLACSNDTTTGSDKTDYSKQKNNLANEEKQKPLSFLTVKSANKINLLGSTVIKGVITNSATVCTYKEVRLKLLSFDKNGQRLEEHEDVINAAIQPNSSKGFKLRYHLPKNTDSISVSIMSVVVAE